MPISYLPPFEIGKRLFKIFCYSAILIGFEPYILCKFTTVIPNFLVKKRVICHVKFKIASSLVLDKAL